jgi:hypothetical protein
MQDVRDLSLAQARRIKFKLKDEARVVHLEAAEAIRVGELRERTELDRRESGLQAVSDFDQCHAEIISGAGKSRDAANDHAVDRTPTFL